MPPDQSPSAASPGPPPPPLTPAQSRRLEAARACAESALRALAEYGLMPTPANFALFYEARCGGRPDLRAALEAALARGCLDEAVMAELAARFYAPQAEAKALADALLRFQNTLRAALEILACHGAETEATAASLAELSTAITPDPLALARALDRIATEAQAMLARCRATSCQLRQSAEAVEKLRAELEAARREALTDPLTSLPNRRAFDSRFPEILREAEAQHRPVALMLIDIDHFKSVNDRFGHSVGDAVLARTAQTLRAALRQADLPARIGGEEFAVLLPGTAEVEALAVADRLRLAVASQNLTLRATGARLEGLTVSIGLAMHRPGEEPAALFERADSALYRAKMEGRNRLCSAEARPAMAWGD
ncbi:MAG: GGDEF domain-containing protein [Rhodovarius sp.]|nr:GGDEF domain-containing protein [Rhodovarius sp.]